MASFCTSEDSFDWKANPAVCENQHLYGSRRSSAGGDTKDTVDTVGTRFFIDVGCWQGGRDGKPKTTYAVISETDVLLCDWLGTHYNSYTSYTCPPGTLPPSAKVKAFLKACQAKSRGGAIAWGKASKNRPFTNPGELIVVVPDFHLHLFKTEKVDRFVYRKNPANSDEPLISLDDEFAQFIDLAKDQGAKVVHIGDMYEVWESEMILRIIYRGLLDYVHDWFKALVNVNSPTPQMVRGTFEQSFPNSALKQMIMTGKVIPTEPGEGISDYIAKWRNLQWVPSIEAKAVDFSSTQAICAAIERCYPGVFGLGNKIDVRIWGNHDNSAMNQYWESRFVTSGFLQTVWAHHNCDMYSKLAVATKGWLHGQKQKFCWPSEGDPRVWVEHGHIYDWHNNDTTWGLNEHGFDVVFRGPMNEGRRAGGYIDLKLERGRFLTDHALEAADWYSAFTRTEMRLPELRRTDSICGFPVPADKYRSADPDELPGKKDDGRPLIVLMGHTHEPEMIECLMNTPFRKVTPEMDTRFNAFMFGDKYLDQKWENGGAKQYLVDELAKEEARYEREQSYRGGDGTD